MILGVFFVTSCGEPAAEIHPSKVDMNLTVKSGEWVQVEAGEFLSGFNEHHIDIDYNYEIMKTEVTNQEYVNYLNDALAVKKISVNNESEVMGNYHGDILGGGVDEYGVVGKVGRHEKLIKNQDYQYYNLAGERARISFINGEFVVVKGYENFPVVYVSWMGAYAFADFYGWRLPQKLEWEKAARGTEGNSYPFGNFEIGPDNGPLYGNYHHSGDPFDSFNGLTPIGFYNGQTHGDFKTEDSKSPYGCYDIAGNAGEWTGDILRGSHQRYIMGGTMMEYGFEMRSATENSGVPGFDDDETGYNKPYMSFQVGFRCARGEQGEIHGGSSH